MLYAAKVGHAKQDGAIKRNGKAEHCAGTMPGISIHADSMLRLREQPTFLRELMRGRNFDHN
jgi:hypothetical protein